MLPSTKGKYNEKKKVTSFVFTFQSSGSSGTITSTSSLENETDHASIIRVNDGGDPSKHKGDSSGISYTNLLNDDDSGIVVRTDSQSSLDRTKLDSNFQSEKGTLPVSRNTSTEYDLPPPRPAPLKSNVRLPPPRPAPRKSMSPNIAAAEDHVIRLAVIGRERPQPMPRKQSFERNLPKPCGDSLIDLDSKTAGKNVDNLSNEFDSLNMNQAGDYVLLREPKTVDTSNNRRSSISRTPAMKLNQNETPKRPSIRRERSPVSPDEPPKTGLLDFDPLFDPSSSPSQQTGSQSGIKEQQTDSDDSLLKEWDLGGLTGFSNTPKQNLNQTNFSYTPPKHSVNSGTHRFYTPQPYMANTHSVPTGVAFLNPHHHSKTPPSLPPKPRTRLSTGGQEFKASLFQTQSALETVNQSDPFADLVKLDQSGTPKTSTQKTWETFN